MDTTRHDNSEAGILFDDPREREEVFGPAAGGFFWMHLAAKFSRLSAGAHKMTWHSRLAQIFRALPVAKDILLVARPVQTWESIATDARGWIHAFGWFFLTGTGLLAFLDGLGLYGREQRHIAEGMTLDCPSVVQLVGFEILQAALTTGLILILAICMTANANACHRQIRVRQTLRLLFHAAGPLVLVQFLNAIPSLNVWISWLMGLVLSLGALYHGLPRILKPDVPSAMGLFFSSAVMFTSLMLMGRLLTYWYLTRYLGL
jgi:hypothetical protein